MTGPYLLDDLTDLTSKDHTMRDAMDGGGSTSNPAASGVRPRISAAARSRRQMGVLPTFPGWIRHGQGWLDESERFFYRREASTRADTSLTLKHAVWCVTTGQSGDLLAWNLNAVVPSKRITGTSDGRDFIEPIGLPDYRMSGDQVARASGMSSASDRATNGAGATWIARRHHWIGHSG